MNDYAKAIDVKEMGKRFKQDCGGTGYLAVDGLSYGKG